jgi:hypothetical protein
MSQTAKNIPIRSTYQEQTSQSTEQAQQSEHKSFNEHITESGTYAGGTVVRDQRASEAGERRRANANWISEQRRQEYRVAPLVKGTEMPETSMAEWLLSIKTKPLIQRVKTPTELVTKGDVTVRPFAGIAGVIAPFEATAYSAARLAGFKTPSIPPTLFSFRAGEALGYGSEYVAGTAMGDILLSVYAGKAAGKVWEALPESIIGPVEKVGEKITQPISKKFGALKEWITGEKVAPSLGIVDVPDIGYTAPRTMSEKVLGLPESASPYQLGFKGMEAEATAMEMGVVPKTAILDPMLTVPTELPLTQQLYAFPSLPYLPSSELLGKATVSLIPIVAGALAIQIPKLLPSPKAKAFEESFPLFKQKLFPEVPTVTRQKERTSLIPKISVLTSTSTIQAQETKQSQATRQASKQTTKQQQKLIQSLTSGFTPKLMAQTIPNLPYESTTRKRKRKRKATSPTGLYGRYPRMYPVATAKQVLKEMMR